MGKFSYSANVIYCSISKLIFLLFIALQSSALFSQSEFVKGYEAGYRETACYYYDAIRCNYLKIPLAPVPTDKEGVTYKDGFNRGIQEALQFFYAEQDKIKIEDHLIPATWKYLPNYDVLLNSKNTSKTFSTGNYTYRSNMKQAFYAIFNGQERDASVKINLALNSDDYTPEAYALLGYSFYKQGSYESAVSNLKKALKEDVDRKEDVKLLLKSSKRLNSSMKKSSRKRQKRYSSARNSGDLYRPQIYPDAYSGVEFRGGLYRDGDYNTVFGGLNLTISLSRRSSIIFDFESFTPLMTYKDEYSHQESQVFDFIQGNLLFRHRLANRLEFLYGPGVATTSKGSDMFFYYAVGGFQIFMNKAFFLDARINYNVNSDKLLFKPGEMNVKLGLGLRL